LKLKTHRGAHQAFKSHWHRQLLRMHSASATCWDESAGRVRKLKKLTKGHKADVAKTMQMLPYG